jgi:hypothetical protein
MGSWKERKVRAHGLVIVQYIMEESNVDEELRASTRKGRIPKACQNCRSSKVRCDEARPTCTKCKSLKKLCVYVEKPKTVEEQRIEKLEQIAEEQRLEIVVLRRQLDAARQSVR